MVISTTCNDLAKFKETSWPTKQSKIHYRLYWTKNVEFLSLIFQPIHPWLSAFWCFVLLGKNVLGGGERRRKTFTQ